MSIINIDHVRSVLYNVQHISAVVRGYKKCFTWFIITVLNMLQEYYVYSLQLRHIIFYNILQNVTYRGEQMH